MSSINQIKAEFRKQFKKLSGKTAKDHVIIEYDSNFNRFGLRPAKDKAVFDSVVNETLEKMEVNGVCINIIVFKPLDLMKVLKMEIGGEE
jgi:hypothetical protein